VDATTGAQTTVASSLTAAIDVTPLFEGDAAAGFLTLEFDLNFPASGPGRLQYFSAPDALPVILADCLTTSSSMVFDRKGDRLVITELATGRLVTFELP
jgi:hypothetical protein